MSILLRGKQAYYPILMPDQVKKIQDLLSYIKPMGFCELSKDSLHDLSVGWVDAIATHDTDNFENHIMGPYHVFGVRIDNFKFSKNQIQPLFDRIRNRDYDPGTPLTRQDKLEITNAVLRHLRSNSIPQTKLEYVVFDYLSGLIYILSTSESVISKVIALLERTFESVKCVDSNVSWLGLPEPSSVILTKGIDAAGKHYNTIFVNWLKDRSHSDPDFRTGDDSWVIVADRTVNFTCNGTAVTLKSDTCLDSNSFAQTILDESGIEFKKLQFQLIHNDKSWIFTLPVNSMHPTSIEYTGAPVTGSVEEVIEERISNVILFKKYFDMTITIFTKYYKDAVGV